MTCSLLVNLKNTNREVRNREKVTDEQKERNKSFLFIEEERRETESV